MAINSMCIDCAKYGKYCNGTECQTWSDCIKRETVKDKKSRIFNFYMKDLLHLAENGTLRYNCIEYVCSFPKIDPAKMGATQTILTR